MGVALADMQDLSTESLVAGVVDEIINADPILPRIPFNDFVGEQYAYNRESTLPTSQFYDIDEVIPEGAPTYTNVTVTLKQHGLFSDIPGFYDTLNDTNDQRATNISKVAKAVLETIGDKVVYGNATSATKEFNGIHALAPSGQTTNEGSTATGSALNFSNVDIAMHDVKNGRIQVATMTREVHRRVSAFVNHSGSNTNVMQDRNEFGVWIMRYNGVELEWSDRQVQTETIASSTFSAKTGGATSSIFFLQFGEPNSATPGIFGIQGPGGLEMIPRGWLEDKDTWRDFIRWRLALGLGSTISISRIDGITDAAAAA